MRNRICITRTSFIYSFCKVPITTKINKHEILMNAKQTLLNYWAPFTNLSRTALAKNISKHLLFCNFFCIKRRIDLKKHSIMFFREGKNIDLIVQKKKKNCKINILHPLYLSAFFILNLRVWLILLRAEIYWGIQTS